VKNQPVPALTFGLWGLRFVNLEKPGKLGKSERNLLTFSAFTERCPSSWLLPLIDKDEADLRG